MQLRTAIPVVKVRPGTNAAPTEAPAARATVEDARLQPMTEPGGDSVEQSSAGKNALRAALLGAETLKTKAPKAPEAPEAPSVATKQASLGAQLPAVPAGPAP